MMPGDSKTATLDIDNDGTAELRYAMNATASGTLGDALTLEVRGPGTSCAAFDGTVVLASTTLDGAAIGNPALGTQGGERILAAAADETLCCPRQPAVRLGQHAPGPDVRRDLRLRRRADGQQPVTRITAAPRSATRRRVALR